MLSIAAALALLPQAGALPTVTASVNLSATATPFPHFWKRCVGSGHMLLGTRSDWRAHLKLAHDELGMTGIRGHGLFDDDMSVVPRKGQYEFYNVDQVFDYLMEIGVRPIVELSFMPSRLVKCGGTKKCSYAFGDPGSYKGLIMPPDDFQDWYDLVKALSEHLVSRYGLSEVQQWHFEVWNEMWGISFPEPYMKLYNASALALKAVDPQLRVGGPATEETFDVPEFIQQTKSLGVPVDFISTHLYPTDPPCQTDDQKYNADCFADKIKVAQASAKQAGLPFFMTEYNNGHDLGNVTRDTSNAAGFVFRNIGLLDGIADVFSWWTFSDNFEEAWMLSAPFHGGYGMMTVQGIRKPVWRAFELLAGAGDKRIPVEGAVSPIDGTSTVSVLATSGSDALGLQLFVANYHRIGELPHFRCDSKAGQCVQDASGTYTDKSLCNANCNGGAARHAATAIPSTCPGRNVTLTIVHSGDAAVPATAVIQRIDETHANPQAAWQKQGSPTYPSASQLAELEAASKLVKETVAVVRIGATSSTISLYMPPFSTAHITL